MTKFRVVVTEKSGESYVLKIRAINADQAEEVTIDALTNFYGETFDGIASAMI